MYRTCCFLIALGIVFTGGCTNATDSREASADGPAISAPTVASAHGAWLGEGAFTAPEGTQEIKAQLELLQDGTYRFMVIEPRALMMVVGLEKGKWKLEGESLDLAPFPDQTSEGTGKLGALNSAPKNFRPKTLSVDGDAFVLKDAQMNLRFSPNLKATEKLREVGDI